MNLSADSLTLPFIVFGWLLCLVSLLWALKTAPWHKVEHDQPAQRVWLSFTVVVLLVWQFSASIGDGLTFHFLLMSLITLMFGVQFAIVAMLLALLGVTWQSELGWLSFGLNATTMGVVPIMITQLVLKLSYRYLEQNFFVFILFNAFFASALGVVVSLSIGAWVMWSVELHSIETLKQSFLPYIPLMATPEGFVNALILTAVLVLKPHWVSSYRGPAISD